MLDLAVVTVVHSVIRIVVDDGFDDPQPSLGTALLTLAFVVAYEVGMVAARGGTIGKLALGMRVVDSDGATPPSVSVAAMRWLPNLTAIVPFVGPVIALALVGASVVWMFTDPGRRSVFDRVANTHVVSVR